MRTLIRYRCYILVTVTILALTVRIHRIRLPGELPKYVLGKGVWIWRIDACEGDSIPKIVERAKNADLDYILVKTHDGRRWTDKLRRPYNSRKQIKALIETGHKADLKVYAWGYVYGNFPAEEASRAIESFELGADGYVFDVEGEFRNKRRAAEILCSKVRHYVDTQCPEKIIGYSTYCRVARQQAIPYEIFGRYSDVAMPQAYWATFNWDPEQTAHRMCGQWIALERDMKEAGWEDAIKPIIPTAHAYRKNIKGAEYIPADQLADFLEEVKGYFGVNVWVWDFMGDEHWKVLRDAPGGLETQRPKFPEAVKPGPIRLALWFGWLWWIFWGWLAGTVFFTTAAWCAEDYKRDPETFRYLARISATWPYRLYRYTMR